jgi:hypothetical protein
MSGIEHLLTVARAYAGATRLDLSTVSWRSTGDTKKLPAIERGADIQVKRLERTLQWFSDNWPDVPWPDGVPRPAASVVAAE